MRSIRIREVLCASVLSAAALAATSSAFADNSYDGNWNVTIITKAGTCEPTFSYPVTVRDGKVGASGEDVSGSVSRDGIVKVSIKGAYANGALAGNGGSGKWNGASAGVACSGRWEAARSN